VVALVLATLALFGTQAWTGYLNQTLPAQVAINADPTGYMPIAHSIVDRLVLMGADVSVARYLQLGIAGAACLATLIAFGRPYPPAHRFFVAAASTMAALPYVAIYDQAVVALAALALLAAGRGLGRPLQVLLLFLWASPIIDLWSAMNGYWLIAPFVGPVALVAVLLEPWRAAAVARGPCSDSSAFVGRQPASATPSRHTAP
jgi:hypothetical protein